MLNAKIGGEEGVDVSVASGEIISHDDFTPLIDGLYMKKDGVHTILAIPRSDLTLLVKFIP